MDRFPVFSKSIQVHDFFSNLRKRSGAAPRLVIVSAATAFLLFSAGGAHFAHAGETSTECDHAEAIGGGSLRGASMLANGATLGWLSECPVAVSTNVSCADLFVPERRSASDSPMITVGLAVLPALDDRRHPDPVVFLMGGQGQGFSVLNDLAGLAPLLGRDIITLEQRGTQLADPFFGCPSVNSGVQGIDQVLTSQPSSADPHEIAVCKGEIKQLGIDRDAYDTAASADDLWDLKQLLGVDDWNLFGVSYGGRTAESFLRKHPDGARSLVLDSPQVTGIPIVFGYGRLSKIGSFFSQCAAAEGCRRRFPDLQDHFEQTVARLEQYPVPVIVANELQNLTARAYIRVVTWILYNKPEYSVGQLPAAVIAASGGDYAPLLALEDRYADASSSEPANPGDYPFELGYHIAQQTGMLCKEEYPGLPRRRGQIDLTFPSWWTAATQRVALAEQEAQAWVCDEWRFKPSDPEQGQLPPRNEIPALIVHGDHDTIAPSESQQVLAGSYPNSTRVVFSWTGHAIIERRQACFLPMLVAFIEAPTTAVDTTCAAKVEEPQWLPAARQANEPTSFLNLMHTVIGNQVQDHGFPGCTVHLDLRQVPVGGTVADGFADPSTGRRLTGREPSRMASMTKTYTAAAVLRLFELGKVGLDDGIGQYLTNETRVLLSGGGYELDLISLRQLLHHNSGLPTYVDEMYGHRVAEDPRHRWSRREQIKWALDHNEKPIGAPGETYAYSDTGYVLLGEVIEQVSELEQSRAYRQLLGFDRLDLQHTWFESLEPTPTDLPPLAHQFFGWLDSTDLDPSFDLWGGGGLVATLEDEAMFLRALMTGYLFDQAETLGTMLTIPATNTDARYGMGIFQVEAEDTICWGHSGFWGTSFYHCPLLDVTVASDRYQGITPPLNYDPLQILTTALRINRLAVHPAKQVV